CSAIRRRAPNSPTSRSRPRRILASEEAPQIHWNDAADSMIIAAFRVRFGGDSMLSGCPEFDGLRLQRRHLLKIGAFGLAGAALPGVMQANQPRGRARSVIFLYQFGGPSHHDTFDLKPDAPDNVRGEFRPIDTSVTSLRI